MESNANITIFKNLFDPQPYYLPVEKALERIRIGKSRERIEEIRNCFDKDKVDSLKKMLVAVCFSGKFKERKDEALQKHSGLMVLDYDEVEDVAAKRKELQENKYSYAVWLSPRGNGLKQLVKIANGKKHREHFKALKKIFTEIDPSGINPSRVCFESFDPDIFINEASEIFKDIIKEEVIVERQAQQDTPAVFKNLQNWLINSGTAFQSGQRNIFVFKLAAACCRFGLPENETANLIKYEYYVNDGDFGQREMERTVKSAYKANATKFGSAIFEREKIYLKETKEEIKPEHFTEEISPKDIIFGQEVAAGAVEIFNHGYKSAETTHIPQLDKHWKFKRGDLTLLSGIGNYGKSAFLYHLLLIKSIKENKKWCIFSPEHFPAEEFYHELTEAYLGCDCTPANANKPTLDSFLAAYDFISKHFFYVYPKEVAPTPEYVQELFLSVIIKEKVDGCIIDPFNQLQNQWGDRDDKYLEKLLDDFGRFSKKNNIFFFFICHPSKLKKENGAYPAPDVYDLANGAMWNNKMDNILVYHRPNHHEDPASTSCQLFARKIRRQKIVGIPGNIFFEYVRHQRRFYFDGISPLESAPIERDLSIPKQQSKTNYYESEKSEMPF